MENRERVVDLVDDSEVLQTNVAEIAGGECDRADADVVRSARQQATCNCANRGGRRGSAEAAGKKGESNRVPIADKERGRLAVLRAL